MNRIALLSLLPLLAGCAGVGSAPQAAGRAVAAQCAIEAIPPPEFVGWATPSSLTSARSAEQLDRVRVTPGTTVELTLHPDGEVAYASLPQGEGEAESFGGIAALRIAQPGRYRVGLGMPAWIDISRAGVAVEAAAFGPGPACTCVRKAVSFDLTPGDYVLEVSGNERRQIRVMVGRSG